MKEMLQKPSKILPHAYPFVFVDRIIKIEEKKRIVCLKNITSNEMLLWEYYKDYRNLFVFPSVFVLEAMIQSSGLMLIQNKSKIAYLCSVKEAVFKKPVTPGDQLTIASTLIEDVEPFYVFNAIATVENVIVSRAELTLALKEEM